MSYPALAVPLALLVAAPAGAAGGEITQPTSTGQTGAASVSSTGAGDTAAVQPPASAPAADDREALLREIESLRARVTALEESRTQVQTTPAMSGGSSIA